MRDECAAQRSSATGRAQCDYATWLCQVGQTVAAGGGVGVLADHVTAVPDVVADGESRGFRLTQSAGVVGVGGEVASLHVANLAVAGVVGVGGTVAGQQIAVGIVGIRKGGAGFALSDQAIVLVIGVRGGGAVLRHGGAVSGEVVCVGIGTRGGHFRFQPSRLIVGVGGGGSRQMIRFRMDIAIHVVGVHRIRQNGTVSVDTLDACQHAGCRVRIGSRHDLAGFVGGCRSFGYAGVVPIVSVRGLALGTADGRQAAALVVGAALRRDNCAVDGEGMADTVVAMVVGVGVDRGACGFRQDIAPLVVGGEVI